MHSALPACQQPYWSGVFNLLKIDHTPKKKEKKKKQRGQLVTISKPVSEKKQWQK